MHFPATLRDIDYFIGNLSGFSTKSLPLSTPLSGCGDLIKKRAHAGRLTEILRYRRYFDDFF
jgi:hypothetical protein